MNKSERYNSNEPSAMFRTSESDQMPTYLNISNVPIYKNKDITKKEFPKRAFPEQTYGKSLTSDWFRNI
jgi:hypothetical protein